MPNEKKFDLLNYPCMKPKDVTDFNILQELCRHICTIQKICEEIYSILDKRLKEEKQE